MRQSQEIEIPVSAVGPNGSSDFSNPGFAFGTDNVNFDSPTPEPGMLTMLSAGLILLAAAYWRKRGATVRD